MTQRDEIYSDNVENSSSLYSVNQNIKTSELNFAQKNLIAEDFINPSDFFNRKDLSIHTTKSVEAYEFEQEFVQEQNTLNKQSRFEDQQENFDQFEGHNSENSINQSDFLKKRRDLSIRALGTYEFEQEFIQEQNTLNKQSRFEDQQENFDQFESSKLKNDLSNNEEMKKVERKKETNNGSLLDEYRKLIAQTQSSCQKSLVAQTENTEVLEKLYSNLQNTRLDKTTIAQQPIESILNAINSDD